VDRNEEPFVRHCQTVSETLQVKPQTQAIKVDATKSTVDVAGADLLHTGCLAGDQADSVKVLIAVGDSVRWLGSIVVRASDS